MLAHIQHSSVKYVFYRMLLVRIFSHSGHMFCAFRAAVALHQVSLNTRHLALLMLSGRKGGRSNLQVSISAIVYASHGKSKSSPSKKISLFFSLQRSADFHFHDREKYCVLPPPMGNRNTLYERKSVRFFLFRNENASHQTIRKEAARKNQKCFSLPRIPLIAQMHPL